MRSFTVLGCSPKDSGSVYCSRCCPDPANCAQFHLAVFADSEWDCSPPTCDKCLEAIDGVNVIHNFTGDNCEYCGIGRPNYEFA